MRELAIFVSVIILGGIPLVDVYAGQQIAANPNAVVGGIKADGIKPAKPKGIPVATKTLVCDTEQQVRAVIEGVWIGATQAALIARVNAADGTIACAVLEWVGFRFQATGKPMWQGLLKITVHRVVIYGVNTTFALRPTLNPEEQYAAIMFDYGQTA